LIHVLVVDDHPIVRLGWKRLLTEDAGIEVTGEAANAAEATAILQKTKFDAIILDISLPDRSGLELLEDIHVDYPETPVLIVSMHEAEQYAINAFKNGASGYLTKQSAADELSAAIKTIVSGKKFIDPKLAQLLAEQVANHGDADPVARLSGREIQILKLMSNGKKPSEIAELLSISVKTVGTYRARIMDKLSFENNAQIVRFALEHRLTD